MKASVEIPKAFSVRDENEFVAFKHLMARLNPQLRISQVGVGLHVDGRYMVYWGLVHLEGQRFSRAAIEGALREAGFNFQHCARQLDYSALVSG
jgi:hypothetical protein